MVKKKKCGDAWTTKSYYNYNVKWWHLTIVKMYTKFNALRKIMEEQSLSQKLSTFKIFKYILNFNPGEFKS